MRQALGAEFRCVRVDGSCVGVAKTALLDQFRDDRATLVALCSIRACACRWGRCMAGPVATGHHPSSRHPSGRGAGHGAGHFDVI